MIARLRCFTTRTWHLISRRVGRRGALLISSGWLATMYGLSIYYPAPDNATAAYLTTLAPLPWWAAAWITTGGLCFVQAFMRADRVAYGWGAFVTLTYSALMAVSWIIGATPRGWVLGSLFLAIALPLLVGAGWAETLKLRPAHPADTQDRDGRSAP